MDDSILEKKIRETLEKKSKEARVDTLTSQRIQAKVYEAIEEERNMKHKNWKKAVIAAAAICIMGSITAVALTKPKYVSSHSYTNEEVKSYEEAKNMQAGYDAAVKSVEKFSNGYEFEWAVPKYEASHDEDHNELETWTSMSFTYGRGDDPKVSLSADRMTWPAENADKIMTLEDGTELKFHRLNHKFVPPDYEPTEEEIKLQDEGKLNIGYGSSEVEVKVSVSVSWKQNDICYCLFSFNENMSADEMLQMAKEIAES